MKVYELLADKSKWTTGTFARAADGSCLINSLSGVPGVYASVHEICNDPAACQWCFVGAIHKCYPTNGEAGLIIQKVKDLLNVSLGGLYSINDTYDHEQILRLAKELNI